MENKILIQEPLSVKSLLEKDNYIIPIYQRNYAWKQPEIEQLINDISNAIENELPQYYIGTLVVFEKGDNFEIIDGQQRHTTLSLIHASIQNRFNSEVKLNKSNLNYEARKESKDFFDSVYRDFDKVLKMNNPFSFAINQIILPRLSTIKETGKLDKWIEYFYKSVLFFRVEVPNDTDLHHYFETMNNRGEQLEETEVLKAKFMNSISDDSEKSNEFSLIWDKCSDMTSYYKKENILQKEKDTELKEPVLKTISDLLYETKEIIKNKPKEYQELLDKPITKTKSPSESIYNSIINFPNFLLIALKLLKKDVSLNEKNLLKEFGYFNAKLHVEADDFIIHLEKCRENFDSYFVKRNFEDNRPYWVLLSNEKNTLTNDECIVEDDENTVTTGKETQDKLIKIQSMLQSVYFSNVNKDWLFQGMKNISKNNEVEIFKIGEVLYNVLYQYSLKKFKETLTNEFEPKNNGLDISRITFYFVDFLLWESYYQNVRGKGIESFKSNPLLNRISSIKREFSYFDFKQNSSIEHYHPQNPEKQEDKILDLAVLNSFGNLCLISRGANSRFSNFMPLTKKNEKQKSIESLKQALMFSYDSWSFSQIEGHNIEILNLIKNHIKIM